MEMIEYQQLAERTAGLHDNLEARFANFGMGEVLRMCECRQCKGQACKCDVCQEKNKCTYAKIDDCRWVRIGGKKE
jgi:hypothetical protein